MNALLIKDELFSIGSTEKKIVLQRFFKTGVGQYGEGDIFIGVTVPQQREIVKRYKSLPLSEIDKLLKEPYHECRLTALLFLVNEYKKEKNIEKKEKIYSFYLQHIESINNWDLVDLSAPKIVGAHLLDKEGKILIKMAKSDNLWARRIAIVSTWYFIKYHRFNDTFVIAEILLNSKEDLIHKAVGWMLREIGKKDYEAECDFLKKHYKRLPRTTLRYAIERFSNEARKDFLVGNI
jgi:3-methyladenine DNA glycosylase AlkD